MITISNEWFLKKIKQTSSLATFSFVFIILNIVNIGILFRYIFKKGVWQIEGVGRYIYLAFVAVLFMTLLILKIANFLYYLVLIKKYKGSHLYIKKTFRLAIAGVFFEIIKILALGKIATKIEVLLRKKDIVVYKVKDIVLIAIMALATLAFSGVMPLVIPLLTKVFGIAQLVICFQSSFFFAIAITKIRKPHALFIMSSLMGVVLLPMSWIMTVIFLIPALIIEVLNIVLYGGYKNKTAIFASVASFFPLSLLLFYILLVFVKDERYALINSWHAILAIVGVVLLSYLGTFLGIKIVSEITRLKQRRTKK